MPTCTHGTHARCETLDRASPPFPPPIPSHPARQSQRLDSSGGGSSSSRVAAAGVASLSAAAAPSATQLQELMQLRATHSDVVAAVAVGLRALSPCGFVQGSRYPAATRPVPPPRLFG